MANDYDDIEIKPQDLVHITSPIDVKTLLIDGVKGVSVNPSLVRISLTENVLDTNAPSGSPGSVKGRHVINLAMEHGSFFAILGLLNTIADDIKKRSNG